MNILTRLNRKAKRQIASECSPAAILGSAASKAAGSINALFERVSDPREHSKTAYSLSAILATRLVGAILGAQSMRALNECLNTDAAAAFVFSLCGIAVGPGQMLPHGDTINNLLMRLKPSELEGVVADMAKMAVRLKRCFRFRGMLAIAIDATQLFSFKKRHCAHCLTREHKGGPIDYFHYALEAKMLCGGDGGTVLSVATEFIENPDGEFDKQDCELKAAYRLLPRIKQIFPRAKICIIGDALYAGAPFFDLCKQLGFEYIVRFKEGSMPSLAAEFEALLGLQEKEKPSEPAANGNGSELCRYISAIEHGGHELSIARMDCQEEGKPPGSFAYIASMPISSDDEGKQIVGMGRKRWKIENEGFKSQKHDGMHLEHAFSLNYNAMKCHYLLIQLAHYIWQLALEGLKKIYAGTKSACQLRCELAEPVRDAGAERAFAARSPPEPVQAAA
jgi:hypothetical protein